MADLVPYDAAEGLLAQATITYLSGLAPNTQAAYEARLEPPRRPVSALK